MVNPKFEAPSWDQIYEMLVDLALKIKGSGFRPDVIVGVSRGGWPPARVMSDLLQNENLANLKVVFYRDIGVRNRKPMITQPVTSEVAKKRVLVVDDVADSGHSLRVVCDHLRRKGAREIRVCTIYFKPHSIFKPDYYEKTTSKWVIFPWERLEAVRLISRKMKDRSGRAARVVSELKGSGLSTQLVRELLRINIDN